MPQLDIVTYFPQSFWFTLLFWAGFFYFLYDMFPVLVNLLKVRLTFVQQLATKFEALNAYYLTKIGALNILGSQYLVPAYRAQEDKAIKDTNLTLQNTTINKIYNFYYVVNRKFF